MPSSRLEEVDELRQRFINTPAFRSGVIGSEMRELLFRNSGLFDAITTEMTAEEVPEGHIVVVTEKAVTVQADFRLEKPPLTMEQFDERMKAMGETVIAITDPRTNPTVSASLGNDALGRLPRN